MAINEVIKSACLPIENQHKKGLSSNMLYMKDLSCEEKEDAALHITPDNVHARMSGAYTHFLCSTIQ